MLEYVMMLGMLGIAVLVLLKVLLPQPRAHLSPAEAERERANAAVDTIKKRMNEFAEKRKEADEEVMAPGGQERLERKLSDSEGLSDDETLKTVT
jgi:hypothetical protein